MAALARTNSGRMITIALPVAGHGERGRTLTHSVTPAEAIRLVRGRSEMLGYGSAARVKRIKWSPEPGAQWQECWRTAGGSAACWVSAPDARSFAA